jgi:hypothetical protein
MLVEVHWDHPIPLLDGSREHLIYTCEDLDALPDTPGVYVFARKHGSVVDPLYIGQARNVRTRIIQQFNNVRLMNGVRAAPSGARILLVGKPKLRGRQNVESVLDLVERALIQHALAEGHELLNYQGTHTRVDVVRSYGNRTSQKVAPLEMNVKAGR